MGETYEIPHQNLANFEPHLGYATERQAVGDIPLQNTMAEMGKLDHLEERLMAIEEDKDYAFADLEELFLVPNIITPP